VFVGGGREQHFLTPRFDLHPDVVSNLARTFKALFVIAGKGRWISGKLQCNLYVMPGKIGPASASDSAYKAITYGKNSGPLQDPQHVRNTIVRFGNAFDPIPNFCRSRK